MTSGDALRAAAVMVEKAWWQRGMAAPKADASCLVNTVGHVLGGSLRYPEPFGIHVLALLKAELGVSTLEELYAWNDAPERQQHEVVALLRAVAVHADQEDPPVVTWTARESVVKQGA